MLIAMVGVAFSGNAGSSTNRIVLEITVGECEASLRDRLPETTSKRLSPEDLAQHNPASPVLTQRLLLPPKGRLTQELRCDEFTIHLDLDCHFTADQKKVTGGVSSSYAFGKALLRPSHWNCFAVEIGQPLYMGCVKGGTVYLIVGRFRLAEDTSTTSKDKQ
jgi:hypothetical protein